MSAVAIKETNVVYVNQSRLVTNSRVLAETFGKQHKNVLQKIEARIKEHTKRFVELNFQPVTYRGGNGEQRPMYELTKDGFMAIAMTFTGKKGSRFRELVIEEFNRREDELRKRNVPVLSTAELLQRAIDEIETQTRRADLATAQVNILQDNGATAAIEYGLTSSDIYSDYPVIRQAALDWAAKQSFSSTFGEKSKLTCYLQSVHGLYTRTIAKYGGLPCKLFNRADIKRIDDQLRGRNNA